MRRRATMHSFARITDTKHTESRVDINYDQNLIHLAPSTSLKFHHVFAPNPSNKVLFERTVKPLCDTVINSAINGIFISHGATQCGKTQTLLGNLSDTGQYYQAGLLSMAMQYLLRVSSVKSINLSAVELYGTSATSVQSFDLLDPRNKFKSFQTKTPLHVDKTGNILLAAMSRSIADKADIYSALKQCQFAPHLVKSQTMYHANRGHVVYSLRVVLKQHGKEYAVYLLFMDLAGIVVDVSNSLEFDRDQDQHPQKSAKRNAETECLDHTLLQLQSILEEIIIKKRQRRKRQSVGFEAGDMRHLLRPIIQWTDSQINMLLAISPRKSDRTETFSKMRLLRFVESIDQDPQQTIVNNGDSEIDEQSPEQKNDCAHCAELTKQANDLHAILSVTQTSVQKLSIEVEQWKQRCELQIPALPQQNDQSEPDCAEQETTNHQQISIVEALRGQIRQKQQQNANLIEAVNTKDKEIEYLKTVIKDKDNLLTRITVSRRNEANEWKQIVSNKLRIQNVLNEVMEQKHDLFADDN